MGLIYEWSIASPAVPSVERDKLTYLLSVHGDVAIWGFQALTIQCKYVQQSMIECKYVVR